MCVCVGMQYVHQDISAGSTSYLHHIYQPQQSFLRAERRGRGLQGGGLHEVNWEASSKILLVESPQCACVFLHKELCLSKPSLPPITPPFQLIILLPPATHPQPQHLSYSYPINHSTKSHTPI